MVKLAGINEKPDDYCGGVSTMTKEFKEVDPNDFLTFSKESPAHVLIEGYVIEIGGGGKAGRNGHQVNANRAKIGSWERFTLFKSKY